MSHIRECDDPVHEEDVMNQLDNPRAWWNYIYSSNKKIERMIETGSFTHDAVMHLFVLHERALVYSPDCFKIWYHYLLIHRTYLDLGLCRHYSKGSMTIEDQTTRELSGLLVPHSSHANEFKEGNDNDNELSSPMEIINNTGSLCKGTLSILDSRYDHLEENYCRALRMLPNSVRIWEEYLKLLTWRRKLTKTRRTLYEGLATLPITQHFRLWEVIMTWIGNENDLPFVSVSHLFEKYLMIEPDHAELYTNYLKYTQWDDPYKYQARARYLMQIIRRACPPRQIAPSIDLDSIQSDSTYGHNNDNNEISERVREYSRYSLAYCEQHFLSLFDKKLSDIWSELVILVTYHGNDITMPKPEVILRAAIRNLPDNKGFHWHSLAMMFARRGMFCRTRDVYEEALSLIEKVDEFTVLFTSYQTFLQEMIEVHIVDNERDCDLYIDVLEVLLERRGILESDVCIRANSFSVAQRITRARLYFSSNPTKAIEEYETGISVLSGSNKKGDNKNEPTPGLWRLFNDYVKFYISIGDTKNVIDVFERAVTGVKIDERSIIWRIYIEYGIRTNNPDVWSLCERVMSVNINIRSTKLFHLCADCARFLKQSMGATRKVYNHMIQMKIATIQTFLDYASFEESYRFFEKSYRIYERGLSIYKWPQSKDLWLPYISSFIERNKGKCLERTRDLFERCLEQCLKEYPLMYYMYSHFEELYGLNSRQLEILSRAVTNIPLDHRSNMYTLLLTRTREVRGVLYTREVYANAIEHTKGLLKGGKDTSIGMKNLRFLIDICMSFSDMEVSLGEVDRGRAILVHTSQFCNPHLIQREINNNNNNNSIEDCEESKSKDIVSILFTDQFTLVKKFWSHWKEFEILHGNSDTYLEMRRIYRSVYAFYSKKHFNSVDISHEIDDDDIDKVLESAVSSIRNDSDTIGTKDVLDSRIENIIEEQEKNCDYIPYKQYSGAREGYVFKNGSRGLGYYTDIKLLGVEM